MANKSEVRVLEVSQERVVIMAGNIECVFGFDENKKRVVLLHKIKPGAQVVAPGAGFVPPALFAKARAQAVAIFRDKRNRNSV